MALIVLFIRDLNEPSAVDVGKNAVNLATSSFFFFFFDRYLPHLVLTVLIHECASCFVQ